MRLTIKNTHIFDNRVQEEFREFIELKKDKLDINKAYKLKIIYNAGTLLVNYKLDFDNSILNSIKIRFTDKDKKESALGYQLEKCRDILKDFGVECYNSSIEGDILKNDNIKIELKEDKTEPFYIGKGKNKERMGIVVVMPNKEYTTNTISKLMSEIYLALRKFVSIDIICKILDIEYTEDENLIYKVFCDVYGNLWLCSKEEEKKLKEKLLNRIRILMEMEKRGKEISGY